MQQAVVVANWNEDEIFGRVCAEMRRRIPSIEALVIDDTGFAKKGRMSPCVHRQYSGTLGRVDNCLVAVSLHIASDEAGACIGMRLFMPEAWAEDTERRRRSGIPGELEHRTKWQMALDMIDAREKGGLTPETVKTLAADLPANEWHHYVWKNGQGGNRAGRFAALRVRHAYRAGTEKPPGDEQWLLIQWNEEDDEPSHYWFSNLPANETVGRLVYLAKLRWRIERDYQEMIGELGLDHFEGRTWSGFHHHCAMEAAAHAFLALERALFPPGLDLAAGR